MKTLVKTLLLISVCLLATNTLSAQIYEPDVAVDKFVGTWEWASGSDKFQIVLTKQKLLRIRYREGKKISYYTDDVVGWHSYTRAGKLIESSMDKVNMKFTTSREAYDNSTIRGIVAEDNYIDLFLMTSLKKRKGEQGSLYRQAKQMS